MFSIFFWQYSRGYDQAEKNSEYIFNQYHRSSVDKYICVVSCNNKYQNSETETYKKLDLSYYSPSFKKSNTCIICYDSFTELLISQF